jgi:Family of unknown function (DUF6493)
MNEPVPVDRIEWPQLRDLIDAECPFSVARRLAPVPPAELKQLRKDLKVLRDELRIELRSGDGSRLARAGKALGGLYIAGIMCSETPAEAFGWLTTRWLMDGPWCERASRVSTADSHPSRSQTIVYAFLLEHRDRAWQQDLAVRLAHWLPARGDWERSKILRGLIAGSGAWVPATDGFILGWAREGTYLRNQAQPVAADAQEWFADPDRRRSGSGDLTLLQWLRQQSRLAEYVPRLFEVAGIGGMIGSEDRYSENQDDYWPRSLAVLAGEGAIDRNALLDQCLAKLLHGDSPGNLRGFVAIYDHLLPTVYEVAARVDTFTGLVVIGTGLIAKRAQADLRKADESGLLDPDHLVLISPSVLARTEKTLVIAQLAWLDAGVRRDPASADTLLRAVATAFGHPAPGVQQRALRLVAKHLKLADPTLLSRLRDDAQDLDAALRQEAQQILGVEPDEQGPNALRPADEPALGLPGYRQRAIPPAIGSPAELVGLFTEPFAGRALDAWTVERVLEAVVAEHNRDPEALVAAADSLARADPKVYDKFACRELDEHQLPSALRALLDEIRGGAKYLAKVIQVVHDPYKIRDLGRPQWITLYRIYEVAWCLHRQPIPVLLATPTEAGGALDPAVLLERLRRYESADARALPEDLRQALLRLPTDIPASVEGEIVALAGPLAGVPDLSAFTVAIGTSAIGSTALEPGALEPGAGGRLPEPDHRPLTHRIGECVNELCRSRKPELSVLEVAPTLWAPEPSWLSPVDFEHWPMLLPHHPDLIATHALPYLREQAGKAPSQPNPLLPLLAETAGVPGPLTHVALVLGLAAGLPQNRVAAADAFLILAARGLLNARSLGALAAELWFDQILSPARLLGSLRDAAVSGAYREVFGVVAGALPLLAAAPEVRGLPDLLLLGSECAAATGIKDQIPAVAGLTKLAKPARVAREARRLQQILGQV